MFETRSIYEFPEATNNKMAEEQAKNDFSIILSSIDRKFEIIHTKWTENKYFEAKFRTQIDRHSEDFNGLCDEWVDLFSEVTHTVWVKKISNTGPKIRFRKQYQCWTHEGKIVQKELLFDARKCKATLDMKVLTDNPLTRRKNKHIRLGLNVVVKINFTHLHPVDTCQVYSFFVHTCETQPEPPKRQIQPNERLPQLVAEMVQKGYNSSQKKLLLNPETAADNPVVQISNNNDIPQQTTYVHENIMADVLEEQKIDLETSQFLHDPLQLQNNLHQTIQLIQNVPLQSMEGVKLELQPQLQPFTQVVVSSPQLDVTEQLLMCQPLMFDTSQVIPISSHNLSSHFVQVHNMPNQQGHFL